MASIPIDQIVTVNPGVLAAAGSAVDLNGLILTQNAYAPIGSVLQFASAADVSSYFGPSSTEYSLATIYFNGYENATKKPGKLYMAQYPETAVSAWLRGGSMAAVPLATLQGYSGTLIITVDGTLFTSGTINLSAATSYSNAATIIQAGFTTPNFTVTFDSVHSAFIFTSNTTGATSTITFCTGTLAAYLLLTSATGAVDSQGADAGVPGTFMDSVIAIQQNWACFMTAWELATTAEKEAFAAWSNGKQPRYLFVCQDSDVNAKTAGNTTTFGYYLQSNLLIGTLPFFGDATHAAFVLGFAASLDFTRLNGRATLAFKYQSGLVASVASASDASALITNGYNFFGSYANATQSWNFVYPGSVSGIWEWADTYLNQIWLNANLQLAMVTLLLQVGSIPYNSQGYSLVDAACFDPIDAAVNFGAIRTGVNLSASQIAEIQFALGFDASTTIKAKGWYLQIVDASAAVRAARASPTMTLYYADGQSIQKLVLASIEIQ